LAPPPPPPPLGALAALIAGLTLGGADGGASSFS
jgi:hypothetical protein